MGLKGCGQAAAVLCASPRLSIARLTQCAAGGGLRMCSGCWTACACVWPEGTELNQGYFLTVVCPGVTLGTLANQSKIEGV